MVKNRREVFKDFDCISVKNKRGKNVSGYTYKLHKLEGKKVYVVFILIKCTNLQF